MMQSKLNWLNQCASNLNIDVSSVKQCKESRSVDQILQKYADVTGKVKIAGVPAVAIDNVSDYSCKSFITGLTPFPNHRSMTIATRTV